MPNRLFTAILLAGALFAGALFAGAAYADTRIFLLDGSDGYGIDRCLATGESCGKAAAAALCRARNYAVAVDFGRIDPTEITGALPDGTRVKPCEGRGCPDLVAITCSR